MLYRMSCVLLGALALCCGALGASEGVDDVIKLQRSAVEDDVLIAFVQDSTVAYDLSAEDIQRLEDANVPSTVIVAMLDHGKELRSAPSALPVAPASPAVAEPSAPGPSAVVYAPPPDQVNISLFYGALAPYGTWSQDGGSGWVWEPTDGVRDMNWRPYANNGHWIWTNHGWYWESDSPYGWATFHYGRWGYNSRHRWCWAPDNVWGPAWVDWRQSEEYYGWAPLPFGSRFEAGVGFSLHGKNIGFDFHAGLDESHYTFVPSGNFLDLHLGLVLEPESRRHDVYRRTKIVNNTYVYNDNRIINNGVSMTVVARATNRTIERVTVVDASIAVGQPIRGERRSANTIEVYRPKVANVAPVEPPVMVARQKAAALHASAAVKAEDRKTATVDRQAAQQTASRRVAEEKALLKDKKTSSAVEHKAAVQTNKESKQNAAEEKQRANKDAVTERKAATEAEKQANEKVREAKAEAKAREKASEQHQPVKSEAQPRSANNEAAAERSSANKEAATERKAAAETSRETKQNAAEEKQNAIKEANAERASANKEAATERKAAAETSRESKQNAAEEKQSANKEANAERKDAAAAEKESKREERDSAKEEKSHGKK